MPVERAARVRKPSRTRGNHGPRKPRTVGYGDEFVLEDPKTEEEMAPIKVSDKVERLGPAASAVFGKKKGDVVKIPLSEDRTITRRIKSIQKAG